MPSYGLALTVVAEQGIVPPFVEEEHSQPVLLLLVQGRRLGVAPGTASFRAKRELSSRRHEGGRAPPWEGAQVMRQ